ncbi:LysR family transcriptional regulator [Agromyces sp. MMS24-K17]|uniref:LysR family transcriptional regulator n=1 Tax=Agromyces sp. MMS24-K17 TaxID=3372850 RepID=UPI003753FE29
MRELDLLGTFLEVYRAGSVSGAASRLGLSQPSVSERIARLEERLGVPLFERTTRGVTPTAEADRLAARTADPVDRLRAAWDAPLAEPTGTVRIGGASDVVASRIVPAVAQVAGRGIRLEFTLGLAADLLDALAAGDLDLVVSSMRPRNAAIRSRGLVDEEFVLVAAPSLARTIDPERLEADPAAALAHLPVVAYDAQPSILRRYWRTQFGRRPGNPIAIVVPDLRAVLAAVVAGAGISAIPRYLADPAIAGGSVQLLHRPDESTINTLFVALPAGTPPTAATSLVLDRLFAQARGWDVF